MTVYDANVYQQLRSKVGKGNISGFVERAVVRELSKQNSKIASSMSSATWNVIFFLPKKAGNKINTFLTQ